MTNHYDEMRVSPDPAEAEELRQRLHARMASVARDDRHGRSDLHLGSGRLDPDERVVPLTEISRSDTSIPGGRTDRRRLVMVAAAVVVVIGAAGLAISNRNPDNVDPPPAVTAAPDPAPAVTAAPTPSRSDPASPATTATAPPVGEDISVTPDLIEFGDHLVGHVGRVARDDGRLYVLPGRIDEPPEGTDKYLVDPASETAVLAAFDDAGIELWRTELDGRSDVVVVDGDPWVSAEGRVSRIDASDGRILGDVMISDFGDALVGAFGSVWVRVLDLEGLGQLIRVHPDMSTTTIELPASIVNIDRILQEPVAGAGGIWVPLGGAGVAVVDPDTNQVTVIPVDVIGHEVLSVAVDGDVAYVASLDRVTSFVGGEVVATAPGGGYLGPIDGVFGMLLSDEQFQVLGASDPMAVENRQISMEGRSGDLSEIDGELWMETGRNYDLRRVEFLPESEGGG